MYSQVARSAAGSLHAFCMAAAARARARAMMAHRRSNAAKAAKRARPHPAYPDPPGAIGSGFRISEPHKRGHQHDKRCTAILASSPPRGP
jgi:hypothetical protein